MLPPASSPPDRISAERRRSFLLLLVALAAVGIAVAAFTLTRGDGGTTPAIPSGDGGSGSPATLQTACAEVPPDQALRVDALRRTAQRVRAVIAMLQARGDTAGAAGATEVAGALEALADAQETQRGVRRATRELGQTLASVC